MNKISGKSLVSSDAGLHYPGGTIKRFCWLTGRVEDGVRGTKGEENQENQQPGRTEEERRAEHADLYSWDTFNLAVLNSGWTVI